MTLSGNICDGSWSVSAGTQPTAGGFHCTISLSHTTPEGVFTHEFMHDSVFASEREAVLAGLREGMVWVQLQMSKTLSVRGAEYAADPTSRNSHSTQ